LATLLLFMKRKEGMSPADFRAYYEERHVPLCLRYMAGPERYERHYIEHPPGNELDFDVITTLHFPHETMARGVMSALARDAMPPDVIADEQRFLDRSRTRWALVERHKMKLEPA
jgi:hypothetical protein